jgi:hypothetical protein
MSNTRINGVNKSVIRTSSIAHESAHTNTHTLTHKYVDIHHYSDDNQEKCKL